MGSYRSVSSFLWPEPQLSASNTNPTPMLNGAWPCAPAQRTFLTWVYRVVARGRSNKLTPQELAMPADQACEAASAKFQVTGDAELRAHGLQALL